MGMQEAASMDTDRTVAAMGPRAKARLLAGASHWESHAAPEFDVPPVWLSDGPHGLRKQEGKADHLGIGRSVPSVCYPTASALACSFDTDLVESVGAAIGEEARAQGVGVVLGPGVNLKRSPLCGRNFEYFSEDPLLSGAMGSAMVRGIQSRGVAACVKHLAANNQEHARLVSDSVVDERTLRELYLAPFERVVREAGPWCVMTAYNRLNGTYCSEHPWLLRDVLRGEWGFDGAVVSDWGALSDSVAAVSAGLDLVMPGPRPDHASALAAALENGDLPPAALDAAAGNVIELSDRPRRARHVPYDSGLEEHLALARRAATESAVLLKNDGVLPLDPALSVAVIGSFARRPRYQGSGSSKINPVRLDNIWYQMGLTASELSYADGYDHETGAVHPRQLREAVRVAARAQVAVVVAGLPGRYESEGFDRKQMVMPRGHRELIEAVCAANSNTVVVLQGGAPMEMPWRDLPSAILLMHLSGCQGGGAAVDLLYGRACPSGRLAETWPARLEDTALGSAYPCLEREVLYVEGPYVGYRYFDAAGVEPAYPFGFGLSYADIAYRGLEVAPTADGLEVEVEVANVGPCEGTEVVQVYVSPADRHLFAAPRRLAAFARVGVAPGASARARMVLRPDAFRVWDAAAHAWVVVAGSYEVEAAASSRDVRLARTVELLPATAPFDVVACGPDRPAPAWPEPYLDPSPAGFPARAFAELYGGPLPAPPTSPPYTRDSAAVDLKATFLGRRVLGLVRLVLDEPARKLDRDQREMMREMAQDMPLRSMITSGVPAEMVDGFVDLLNGHRLRGLAAMAGSLAGMFAAFRGKGASG